MLCSAEWYNYAEMSWEEALVAGFETSSQDAVTSWKTSRLNSPSQDSDSNMGPLKFEAEVNNRSNEKVGSYASEICNTCYILMYPQKWMLFTSLTYEDSDRVNIWGLYGREY